MTSPSKPAVEYSQEVRFAIVMYGGISLAIYINGVAQELLHLVRATAPANHPDTTDQNLAKYADSELTGSEKVYRKLGQMLVRGKSALDAPAATDPNQETSNQKTIDVKPAAIRTRFVVDILSGSSAGGINALFLAKALANDQPLKDLESLWVEEGEMAVLINDRDSLSKTNLKVQDPPKSLLNSRRMYWHLLDALDGMETVKQSSNAGSTNIEELDLFVTATDMAGQVIKLQLADRTVQERRHRKVFHFVFSAGDGQALNDFVGTNNPFLAFAARATSAHPAAFEPMTLGGIDQILRRHDKYSEKSGVRAVNPDWRKFYDEYLRATDGGGPLNLSDQALERLSTEFARRAFNDGGVLDNQPFSHTLDTLGKHHANFPTVRKLLYIEPAPEHPKTDPDQPTPDFAANAWLSLSTLPRYEPIREHLQRVLDRNRLIERVQHITQGMEQDVNLAKKKKVNLTALTTEEFRSANLADMVDRYGFGWVSYQRLRVADTTDELVRLMCRTQGFDEDSDHFTTVRQVIKGWRDGCYAPNPPEKLPSGDTRQKQTETSFLIDFDLEWRLRRLRFLMSKTDDLACFDVQGRHTFENAVDAEVQDAFSYPTNPPEDVAIPLRSTLLEIKAAVNRAYRVLRRNRQALWSSPIGAPAIQDERLAEQVATVRAAVARIDLTTFFSSAMEDLSEAARNKAVGTKMETNPQGANFVQFLGTLIPVLDEWFSTTRGLVEKALTARADAPTHEKVLKRALKFYFDHFDRYDMVSHPILYATNAGAELDRIEVFRISPEDATHIVDEVDAGKKKLFGTKLGNFGAFFKRDFRTNDILWGRLDGAERIITALLPDAKYDRKRINPSMKYDETRDRLIEEAQNAILKEVLGVEDESKLTAILKELAAGTKPSDVGGSYKQDTEHAFGTAGAENLAGYLTEPRVRFGLTSFLKNQTPIQVFRQSFLENYETLREFNNQGSKMRRAPAKSLAECWKVSPTITNSTKNE